MNYLRHCKARYELSWKAPKVLIRMSSIIANHIRNLISPKSPLVTDIEETFSDHFGMFEKGVFGVPAGIPFSEDEKGLEFSVDLSKLRMNSEHQGMRRVRMNLYALFTALQCIDKQIDPAGECLAHIDGWATGCEWNHAGLSVSLSKKIVKWSASWPEGREIEPVQKAMIDAWSLMGTRELSRLSIRYDFRAFFFHKGFVSMRVFGDACDLNRDDTGQSLADALSEGYRLTPHNIDSGRQQLSFLAGIAALCDCVRADLKPPAT